MTIWFTNRSTRKPSSNRTPLYSIGIGTCRRTDNPESAFVVSAWRALERRGEAFAMLVLFVFQSFVRKCFAPTSVRSTRPSAEREVSLH